MLADKKPVIAPMDQDDWGAKPRYMETPAPELIALYGLNRHANLRLLQRLNPDDLEKSAFHPDLRKTLRWQSWLSGWQHTEPIISRRLKD